MRVLIAGFDLFGSVGGGQTFYRSVIQRNPHIEFHYLREREGADAAPPANARPVAFREAYAPEQFAGYCEPGAPTWARDAVARANNIAYAVAGGRYDVVDVPDYEQFGAFIRPALRRHGVRADRVALSMHGVISTTLSLNWWADGSEYLSLRRLEHLQYAAADVRYFISEMYRDEWRALCPLPSHYLDPMWFFAPPPPQPYRPSDGPPALQFVGRTEKRKGPHLFVQMLWWLPAGLAGPASVIGPESFGGPGEGSLKFIRPFARARGVDVRFVECMAPEQLAGVFASKSVTVVPSIYDTLNLVALESLFSGCPTVVGSGAGVCRYLGERFPEVPFVTFDVADFFGSLPRVEELLRDYDGRRAELAEGLRRADRAPRGPGLEAAYRAPAEADPAARAETEEWYGRLTSFARPPHAAARAA